MIVNNIYLSKITHDDMQELYKWFSENEFLKYYDYLPPIPQTKEQVDKTIHDYETSETSKVFAIKLIDSNKIIGILGLDDIIIENKVATLFIGIGDKSHHNKGYGFEALKLLLEYGFNSMNLYRIQLNVLEFNNSAIKLYEKAGFIKEGTYRQFVLRDEKRYDLFLYGLLCTEWNK